MSDKLILHISPNFKYISALSTGNGSVFEHRSKLSGKYSEASSSDILNLSSTNKRLSILKTEDEAP